MMPTTDELTEIKPILTEQDVAQKLLYPLFRSIDDGYKQQYLKTIWAHFTDRVAWAAGAETLVLFYERITRKLPITLLGTYRVDVLAVLESGQDEPVLEWLRKSLQYQILLCQHLSQNRREDYEERQALLKQPNPPRPPMTDAYPDDQSAPFINSLP